MTSVIDLYRQKVKDGFLEADPAQEAVLTEFERIREGLAETPSKGWFRKAAEPPKGLYLWGGVGRGKSMLMDLFAAALDVDCRRVHFHAFMQEVQDGLAAARKAGKDDAIGPVADRIIAEVRCLAFDEMQITDIADAMIVGRLFQKLFDGGVVVVTTSNRVPEDLYKDGLNRDLFLPFIALLEERMVVHELVSPKDYRQGRLAGEQVYFSPVDTDAREAIASIWEDLSGGASEELTLRVKGREVVLPRFSSGVARAKFYDLCGRALGPADYLAVAEAVRVLILEDIPTLGRSNFNEAKRFVTLIDALYEAKVRLICSAAAVPEMLYVEGEGSFEFARTASRLQEMQGEGWGG
ncbi:cell division protein ZapE [Aestuariibius insulae]|uniref:cell division protein ZapE n=1 Tax=Aestuariibius insulae TaxID=2058287 RepID=UPI00345E2C21